ncbi:MAG: hypothetical protein ACD_79C00504G0008 [uncultured bacterium]|nr:MAG: hypothetical protein ACD_79C00504G0008 [uncultured bacterium]
MNTDSLIKLTKFNLKELVCKNFTITIPEIVKSFAITSNYSIKKFVYLNKLI